MNLKNFARKISGQFAPVLGGQFNRFVHMKSKFVKREFTLEQEIEIDIAIVRVNSYKILMFHRMNSFDDKGQVQIESKSGEVTNSDGRKFMEDLLNYFENRDESYAYKLCAKLMILMQEYDEHFSAKTK